MKWNWLSWVGGLGALLFVIMPQSTHAYVPARCLAEAWDCTGWSACDVYGAHRRTCTIRLECQETSIPKPSEIEQCAPPACSEDVWSCGTWTPCDRTGRQFRTCSLSYDCPLVTTPKPLEIQTCTQITCKQDEWECTNWSRCSQEIGRASCRERV